jgi:hypothetical protein
MRLYGHRICHDCGSSGVGSASGVSAPSITSCVAPGTWMTAGFTPSIGRRWMSDSRYLSQAGDWPGQCRNQMASVAAWAGRPTSSMMTSTAVPAGPVNVRPW